MEKHVEVQMTFNKTYQDLVTEIEILETRLQDMIGERDFLRKSMYANGPKNIGVIDYSKDRVQNGFVPMSLDRILERLNKIDDDIEWTTELINVKKDALRKIETLIESLEGLEQRVAYLRDVKGLKLYEIARQLGYSHDWIKRISSRVKKSTPRVHQNMDKPMV